MGANLPVNGQRLWADVMALAAVTDPGEPYTRRAFTARFLEGRAFLAAALRRSGARGSDRSGRQSDRPAARPGAAQGAS